MLQARYKGGNLGLIKDKIYNVIIVYDDCDYVWMQICDCYLKHVYDGKEEMEKEWEIVGV